MTNILLVLTMLLAVVAIGCTLVLISDTLERWWTT